MTIVGGTGHRPKALFGSYQKVQEDLYKLAESYLLRKRPDKIVSGMAIGWDLAIASAAANLNIPFIAAVPFPNQPAMWPDATQEVYRILLQRAHKVIMVDDHYTAESFKKRNCVIVDESTEIVAVWNGKRSGTQHCVSYAYEQRKPVENLWEEYTRISGYLI
jgi:uncharacterized phage-like protein YoqJ